jgi:hypothetical protein
MKLALAALLTLTALSGPAGACDSRHRRPACGANQGKPPANFQPQQFQPLQFQPLPNGIAAGDQIINDLPPDAKLAIRMAAAKAQASSGFRRTSR